MAVEIKIRWDGKVDGIAEHRLSLAHFGPALSQLLTVVRRIASATQLGEHSLDRRGRHSSLGRVIDLQLTRIDQGSILPTLVIVTPNPEGIWATANLEETIAKTLIDELSNASIGKPTSGPIRKFFSRLPAGLESQTYEVYSNGEKIRAVQLGKIELAPNQKPKSMHRLRTFEGFINSLVVERDREAIVIRTGSGALVKAQASREQIETAKILTNYVVRVTAVQVAETFRLVRICSAAQPQQRLKPEVLEKHTWGRWDKVLERLSK